MPFSVFPIPCNVLLQIYYEIPYPPGALSPPCLKVHLSGAGMVAL